MAEGSIYVSGDIMMNQNITGRKKECERLEACLSSEKAELVIIYGRRRIGKTYLIDHFFDGRFDFKLTGAYQQSTQTQLENFSDELYRQSGKKKKPKSWRQAFSMLRDYICEIQKENRKDEKIVIFFDEMPWMDASRSDFLSSFEFFWNDFGCSVDELIFIVCGSSTSWIVEKIYDNKGGLYNRNTCRIYLEPFKLKDTEEYLIGQGIHWSRYDIALCYMIIGGIPYYLSLLNKNMTLNENVDNLFFRKRAELWDEYDHLYKTLFSNSERYIKVIEALAGKRYGMERGEIAVVSGVPGNGQLTKILDDLKSSGFVHEYLFFKKKKKNTVYQLCDYYTLFYYRFIKGGFGKDEHYWSHMLDNPRKNAWAGFTFELLCKDHIPEIKKHIGISGVLSEESTWYTRANEEEGISGAQIDLIIDRRDNVINICEIKFASREFEINKKYDLELRNKIGAFVQETGIHKTVQLTFITTFGMKKNKYSGLVNNEVVLDCLF